MTANSDHEELGKRVAALAAASAAYESARSKSLEAARKERHALEALNLEQQRLDEAILIAKGEAPWNSTWYRANQAGKRAAT